MNLYQGNILRHFFSIFRGPRCPELHEMASEKRLTSDEFAVPHKRH